MTIDEVLSERIHVEAIKKLSTLSIILTSTPIVIFGCGNLGKKIANFVSSRKYNLVAFSDNNQQRWGDQINGIPIISPSKASELYSEEGIFIVSIWSPGNSFAKTKEQLAGLGVKNVIHAASLMQLFPDELLPHYHFQTPDYYARYRKEMKEAYDLFADEESQKQYLAHIDCRINLNFEGLPIADTKNQYFPSGVIQLSEQETFLDAGAYDGDTLQDFCERTGFSFKQYIALEPDPQNKEKLEKRIQSLNVKNVAVYPYAVGAENCTLKFDATGGGGAGISTTGSIEVECVRIDDKFYNEKPTYLKFDIEGAELDALAGAQKTIEAIKPKLAVCLYHLPDDLWNIPLYLKSRYPFYKFYARTHQFDGLDFVLYAIPY
jgi:FkbM family methyltransferase